MRSLTFFLLLCACSSEPSTVTDAAVADAGVETSSPADVASGACAVPVSASAILPWLTAKSYASWKAESKVHSSSGPHGGNVRTYISPELEATFSGAGEHARCAATVKELYGNGNMTVMGWAVSVKVQGASKGGDGWYWYELLSMGGSPVADGTGVKLCTNCHAGGRDYVLTPTPLQ